MTYKQIVRDTVHPRASINPLDVQLSIVSPAELDKCTQKVMTEQKDSLYVVNLSVAVCMLARFLNPHAGNFITAVRPTKVALRKLYILLMPMIRHVSKNLLKVAIFYRGRYWNVCPESEGVEPR